MAAITVVYAAVAAGNLLLRLSGNKDVAPILDNAVGLLDRVLTVSAKGRRRAGLRRGIMDALGQAEFAAADAGDVTAADEAVGRVVNGASDQDRLMAAVLSEDALRALWAERAGAEAGKLGNSAAVSAFWFILGATEKFLVRTATSADDFAELAHQQELRDLAALGGQLDEVAEQVRHLPADTLALFAGEVLTLNPPLKPSGRAIEPSRVLLPTAGTVPFFDPRGLLDDLERWVDGEEAFGVRVIGGSGGSGKSRLATELCRRYRTRDAAYWRTGFLGAAPSTEALQHLTTVSGGRIVVLDYAETRADEVASVLEALQLGATSLAPVRVVLLVRNPRTPLTTRTSEPDDPQPWIEAVRSYGRESADALLDDASCTLLNAEPLDQSQLEALFGQALASLRQFVGRAAGTAEASDLGFLSAPDYAQPLALVSAAYLAAAGTPFGAGGSTAVFEGILRHEGRYWALTDGHADHRLGCNFTEHRHSLPWPL